MGIFWRDVKGFTLLEVVIAIVIISALAVAFAPLIASSVHRIKWAGQRTQELYDARSVMEIKLAAQDYSSVVSIIVSGPDKFHQAVSGMVVESGNFVSFVYPQSEF